MAALSAESVELTGVGTLLVDVRLATKQIKIQVNKQKQFSNYKIYIYYCIILI
jgi:hypothetical protein